MLPNVTFVRPLAPFRLFLRFEDGAEGEVDVAAMVPFRGVFEPVGDPAYFAQVRVDQELGTIVWPNGADLDPLVLHAAVTGRSVVMEGPAPRAS